MYVYILHKECCHNLSDVNNFKSMQLLIQYRRTQKHLHVYSEINLEKNYWGQIKITT